jgi:hypothetical protein
MKKSKKIKVLKFAIFQLYIGALIGLLAGIIYSFGGLIIDTLVSLGLVYTSETPGLSYGTILAFGALIGMPLIFAIFGFVLGIIGAIMYNLTARWFGGIYLDFRH